MAQPQFVPITNEEYQQIYTFAHQVASSNLGVYARRGQGNIEANIAQNISGKMAEVAVYKYLCARGKTPDRTPDFEVYADKKDKSFDQDLTVGDVRLHIKSQSYQQMQRYGESYVFQHKDALTRTPDPNDFLVLCLVDETNRQVCVRKVVQAAKLVGVYGEPMKESLKHRNLPEREWKAVLYMKDLVAALAPLEKQ